MKQFKSLWILLLAMVTVLTSCEVIGDILEVGIWIGIIIVVAIIAIIYWIIRKFRR